MGRFLNPDNSAFQVALNSEIYVDKTELLEEMNKVLDTVHGYICNSRPRRFGKSITANMLAAYYSRGCDSKEMFAGLRIGKKEDFEKHLNRYDVIQIDVQWFFSNVKNIEEVLPNMVKQIISELREIYGQYFSGDTDSLPEVLSYIRQATGNKFIIIIDEWDILIREENIPKKIQEEYISFLRGLLKGIEPTKYIKLVYLTGILPIKKEKTQSALNNFEEYTMLNAKVFAEYIGFTEKEVQLLCDKYDCDFDGVKRWYNGYLLNGVRVYNPKAVVEVLRWKQLQSYWSATGTYRVIASLISLDFDGLKSTIMEMISGISVKVNTRLFQNDTSSFNNKDDVLTYLIHLGYLGYDQNNQTAFIPNEEIRQELTAAVESTKWNDFFELKTKSEKLLEATLDMDEQEVAKQIEQIHTEYTSIIQYNNENSLSSVLAIGYLSAMQYYFKPIREMPTGRGFSDFVFIPKTEYAHDYPALIIELKWNKNAETAIKQIYEKKYPVAIEQYTGNIMLVGINYDKSTKEHSCKIEIIKQN